MLDRRTATYPPRGAARLTRRGAILLSLLLLFSLAAGGAAASLPPTREYQVKAAFIYNFMKFVDWPGEAIGFPSTITLGILGKDPFGEALDEVEGKTAKGRRVVVVRFRKVEEVRECDVLFVSGSEKGRLPHILKGLQSARVLTVADQEGFCEAGGMINLVSAKSRIVFEINAGAVGRSRLRVSSQLLKLARSVID